MKRGVDNEVEIQRELEAPLGGQLAVIPLPDSASPLLFATVLRLLVSSE